MRINTPTGTPENPEQPEENKPKPEEKADEFDKAMVSLRSLLDILLKSMEAGNDGKPFTDRERAMIGHAFYSGAGAPMALITYDGPPSQEEITKNMAILSTFQQEFFHYVKHCEQKTIERN